MPRPIYRCTGGDFSEDPNGCPAGYDGVLPPDRRVRLSKFLSGLLRHYPWRAGLTLDGRGWASIEDLVSGIRRVPGFEWVERWHIEAVAVMDPKGRFEVRGGRIRARYGHSLPVEVEPLVGEIPDTLYHGTPEANIQSILASGIKRMKRRRVHLSATFESAVEVGARRGGRVAVIEVDVSCLESRGYRVEKASHLIYTVEYVPPECIRGYRVVDT